MIVFVIIYFMAAIFFIMSICLMRGKGSFLIAGYNTANKEEKEKYDEKKLCFASGLVCLVTAVMLCIMGILGYLVDSGKLREDAMLPFAIIFILIILSSVIASSIYSNTKAKKS